MSELVEIRWHGRGGQGSKTASLLLGVVASDLGLNVQAFPEYGPERMGAPVLAFNRISEGKMTLHCQIESPKIVVVLDPTLLEVVDVTENLAPGGKVLVNTNQKPEKIRKKLGLEPGQVFTCDANKISREEIGAVFPNTPMLGALVKVGNVLPIDQFRGKIEEEFSSKFSSKPEVVEGNLNALDRAIQEVQGE